MGLGNPWTWFDENVLGGSVAASKTTPAAQQHATDVIGNLLTPGQGVQAQQQQGVTAVGTPFAGAGPWLVGFALLAGVTLLMSESGKYASLGTALLALIVFSYFFVSYGKLTAGFSSLWSGAPNLNPTGA